MGNQGLERAWVGIDPGATGAAALVTESGEVEIRDWPGDEERAVAILAEFAAVYRVRGAWIEKQQPMPKNGSIAGFTLGVNYGIWLAAVAARGWPRRVVPSREWRKGLGYPDGDRRALKAHSLTVARRLYPAAGDLLARVKDDGRAEALLLAHGCRKDLP